MGEKLKKLIPADIEKKILDLLIEKYGEEIAAEMLERIQEGVTQTHEDGEVVAVARCGETCWPPVKVRWQYSEDDMVAVWEGRPTERDIEEARGRICAAGMDKARAKLREKAEELFRPFTCAEPCVSQLLFGNITCRSEARKINRIYGWEIRATAHYCMDVVYCCIPPGSKITTPQTEEGC